MQSFERTCALIRRGPDASAHPPRMVWSAGAQQWQVNEQIQDLGRDAGRLVAEDHDGPAVSNREISQTDRLVGQFHPDEA